MLFGLSLAAAALAVLAVCASPSAIASARPPLAAITIAAAALGAGTAAAYPTALAAAAWCAPRRGEHARGVGIYRFCRDLGYAAGGVALGLVADARGGGGGRAASAACAGATAAALAIAAGLFAFGFRPTSTVAFALPTAAGLVSGGQVEGAATHVNGPEEIQEGAVAKSELVCTRASTRQA